MQLMLERVASFGQSGLPHRATEYIPVVGSRQGLPLGMLPICLPVAQTDVIRYGHH
jgi:hypothetical protein